VHHRATAEPVTAARAIVWGAGVVYTRGTGLEVPRAFGEAALRAAWQSQSLSLFMDAIHNLSDELALVFLVLAFILPTTLSKNLQRSANVLNSLGLIAVSGVVVWQAYERLLSPAPVLGLVPVVIGLLAAAANWGVARLLLRPSAHNPSIRLAYLHNLGDVLVSLAPVLAGALVMVTGRFFFDPLMALLIAGWIIWSTLSEVRNTHEQLIWPEEITCGHSPEEQILLS
jgi:cation diffusion facilitator family transporter